MVLDYVDRIFYLDVAFSIENRMIARAFRNIWSLVMLLRLHESQASAKSNTSGHISRNARAIIRFFV